MVSLPPLSKIFIKPILKLIIFLKSSLAVHTAQTAAVKEFFRGRKIALQNGRFGGQALGLFKETFLLKSDAKNIFSRCITPKNDVDQFSQKILMFRGAQLDFRSLRKKNFSGNTGK